MEDAEVLRKTGRKLYLGKSDETMETTPRKMHRHMNAYIQMFAYNFKAFVPWAKNL